jgi:hypothetical protein
MVVLTLGLFVVMYQIEDPNAITFPRVVLSIMLIMGGLLALQALITGKKGGAKSGDSGHPYPFTPFFIALAGILIYFALMERVGFYASGFLFFLIITLLLQEAKVTLKNILIRTGAAAAFMGVLFLLFNKILAVQTPKGLLF